MSIVVTQQDLIIWHLNDNFHCEKLMCSFNDNYLEVNTGNMKFYIFEQ